jgi:hypothetical protein
MNRIIEKSISIKGLSRVFLDHSESSPITTNEFYSKQNSLTFTYARNGTLKDLLEKCMHKLHKEPNNMIGSNFTILEF